MHGETPCVLKACQKEIPYEIEEIKLLQIFPTIFMLWLTDKIVSKLMFKLLGICLKIHIV